MPLNLKSAGGGAVTLTPASTPIDVTLTIPATSGTLAVAESLSASPGSSLVGYLPAGTGAVATTVQSKLRESVSVKDFGAVGDGVKDDTAAIQAAIATGKRVFLPEATHSYRITTSLTVIGSIHIEGEANTLINRAQSYITCDGNFPAFLIDESFVSCTIKNIYIYYASVVPTNFATQGSKIGFKFSGGSAWPEMIHLENCTVRGAWWVYYDSTGTYLSKLTQVIGRDCRQGFYKSFGTTMLFDSCYSAGGITGFYLSNIVSATLLNCAADKLEVDSNSVDTTGNMFVSCHSLSIIGWDAEANHINTNGGIGSAYFRFKDNTTATISGMTGVGNTLKTSGAGALGIASVIRAEGNSTVTVLQSKDQFNGTAIVYSGSGGYPCIFSTDASSQIDVIGGSYSAPTGGSPAVSVIGTAGVSFRNSKRTGITAGLIEDSTAVGLRATGFYTNSGTTTVIATTPVTLFTLPDSAGIYLVNVFVSGSGTNFASSAIFVWDGSTLIQTDLKAGAFTVLSVSGRSVVNTCAGTTTATWSYVRLG